MAVKAQLKVQLFADAVLVAESDDQQLWRAVFGAVQAGKSELVDTGHRDERSLNSREENDGSALQDRPARRRDPRPDGPIASFAEELGVRADDVVGACSPENSAPFIHLDQRYWEALKTNAGLRGRTAISPTALAATLLILWFKHAGLEGNPTVHQCKEVMKTINLEDQNAARSLRNADWLQERSGSVIINPALWSQAVRVAKAYCLKKAPKDVE
jgi:hypothetical protein